MDPHHHMNYAIAHARGDEISQLFDLVDLNNDGKLTRQEVIEGAPLLGITTQQASSLFERLDVVR